MATPSRLKLEEAAEHFIVGIKSGEILTGSGHVYKPSTIRGYEDALNDRLVPELGHLRLTEITRNHLQDLADRWRADGSSPSTVRNALMPLRAIYRRAIRRGEVIVNPTTDVELPACVGRRERIADREEAATLIEAVEARDRALWATAIYGGLRLGEIRGLEWGDVDFKNGFIHIRRSWDEKAPASVATKSRRERSVPIAPILRGCLARHRLACGRDLGLVFGVDADRPFSPSAVRRRAERRWRLAGLRRITPHEARHTCASMLIAAGVNPKAIATFMGHSSIKVTFDIYGKLMPGSESVAASLLEDYLRETAAG